jgi:hypothetical protein
MNLRTRSILAVTALLLLPLAGCGKKEASDATPGAAPAATFTVYPGARYLPELTDTFKRAATVVNPSAPPPPQVLYDTDASLEQVAEFYAKNNGISKVWPDATGDFSTVQPPAYYRTGDLAADFTGIEPVLQKMNMNVDKTKSVGQYRGAHINGNGHPRVTLSRPYFDFTKSQVVDRTLIIMVRE